MGGWKLGKMIFDAAEILLFSARPLHHSCVTRACVLDGLPRGKRKIQGHRLNLVLTDLRIDGEF